MITYQENQKVGALSTGGAPDASLAVERSVLERMIERVLELGMNGTAVTKDVLAEHTEFTRAQIDQYAPEACDTAKSRAVTRLD